MYPSLHPLSNWVVLLLCFADFCPAAGKWGVCTEDVHKENQRGPHTLGPARRVAEQDFVIVVGEQLVILFFFLFFFHLKKRRSVVGGACIFYGSHYEFANRKVSLPVSKLIN